jgi:hypothetical protein
MMSSPPITTLPVALMLAAPASAAATEEPIDIVEKKPRSILEGGLPGTFQIPGTGLSMGFGGYVKLDVIYSSRGTEAAGGGNSADQQVTPGAIPVGSVPFEDNQLTFSARESRLWWKAYMPTDWGDFNAYTEIDFYAFQAPGNERVSNSFAPRLRHAYGTLGPLLAGQTWSTFVNASALPDNLDFVGSVGDAFVRQPQIRWTQHLGETWALMAAVENPETTITSTVGGRITPGDDQLPDVVLGVKAAGSFGNVTLAFVGRQLRIDTADVEGTQWAGGASLAGRVLVNDRDNVRFNLVGGTGLGRYVALNAINGGYLGPDGELAGTIPSVSGHFSYQHFWSDMFRSSATFAFLQAFNPDALDGSEATEQLLEGIVNLLFSPIPRTTFGVEYIIVRREIASGLDGVLHRVQSSAKFVF